MASMIFSILILALPGFGIEPGADLRSFVLCKNEKAVRSIRVEFDKKTALCRTIYSKGGVDREEGSGKSIASCESVKGNIRKNLESASWKCRDVDSAQVSTTKDNQTEPVKKESK